MVMRNEVVGKMNGLCYLFRIVRDGLCYSTLKVGQYQGMLPG